MIRVYAARYDSGEQIPRAWIWTAHDMVGCQSTQQHALQEALEYVRRKMDEEV